MSDEKNEMETLAADLFRVLETAREQGLDMDEGFVNKPLETPSMGIIYMFQPKASLAKTPGMPQDFKQRLKAYNVLAGLEQNGRPVGFYLVCTMAGPFSAVASAEDLTPHMQEKDVENFGLGVRQALTKDFHDNVRPTGNRPGRNGGTRRKGRARGRRK
jgi:hypothetical protein